MNSKNLWNKLSKEEKIIDNTIYPSKELKIKGKGKIKYLKNIDGNIEIHYTEERIIRATNDHVWTLANNKDVHSEELNEGDEILVGETNAVPFKVVSLKNENYEGYSYDVTTESEHFMADDIYSHNCRSFLTPYWHEVEYKEIDELNYEILKEPNEKYISCSLKPKLLKNVPDGDYEKGKVPYNFLGNTGWILSKHDGKIKCLEPKTYGRWNRGVVTLNIPFTAMRAKTEGTDFWEELDKDCEIIHKALVARNESIKKIKAKNAPILWMYGGLSRLSGEKDLSSMLNDIDYTTISFGYIGLYETCMALIGKSNTSEEGIELSKKVLTFLNDKCSEWKEQDKIPYSIYGTPEESLTEKASQALKKNFGTGIYGVTDHDYVTNSYHVNPNEPINAFDKLKLEGDYLSLSKGGAVSYIETTNMSNNPEAIEAVIKFMYDNILYAEVNTKIDYCSECGYQGELVLDDSHGGKLLFHCPKCGCTDQTKLSAIRRMCGYMGEAAHGIGAESPNCNQSRLADIYARYIHLK